MFRLIECRSKALTCQEAGGMNAGILKLVFGVAHRARRRLALLGGGSFPQGSSVRNFSRRRHPATLRCQNECPLSRTFIHGDCLLETKTPVSLPCAQPQNRRLRKKPLKHFRKSQDINADCRSLQSSSTGASEPCPQVQKSPSVHAEYAQPYGKLKQ